MSPTPSVRRQTVGWPHAARQVVAAKDGLVELLVVDVDQGQVEGLQACGVSGGAAVVGDDLRCCGRMECGSSAKS